METLEAAVLHLPVGLLEMLWNKCQYNSFGAIAKMIPFMAESDYDTHRMCVHLNSCRLTHVSYPI